MSDKKIIIRNCPALYQINGMTNECLGTDYQCQDCTDCLLKQIVDECNKGINYSQCNCGAISNLVNILDLLDIEECE